MSLLSAEGPDRTQSQLLAPRPCVPGSAGVSLVHTGLQHACFVEGGQVCAGPGGGGFLTPRRQGCCPQATCLPLLAAPLVCLRRQEGRQLRRMQLGRDGAAVPPPLGEVPEGGAAEPWLSPTSQESAGPCSWCCSFVGSQRGPRSGIKTLEDLCPPLPFRKGRDRGSLGLKGGCPEDSDSQGGHSHPSAPPTQGQTPRSSALLARGQTPLSRLPVSGLGGSAGPGASDRGLTLRQVLPRHHCLPGLSEPMLPGRLGQPRADSGGPSPGSWFPTSPLLRG